MGKDKKCKMIYLVDSVFKSLFWVYTFYENQHQTKKDQNRV